MADKKTKLMAQFYEQCQSKGYTNMNDPTQSLKAKVIATDLKLNYGDIVAFYEKAKQSYERLQAEATEAAQVAEREAARKAVNGTLLVAIHGEGKKLDVFVRPDGSFYTTNNSGERMEGTPKITVKKGGVLHTTYNPAQAVYTSATVGGITTGGVHYTKESYSQSVSQTGTGYITACIGSDEFTVGALIMSEHTAERFKRDKEYLSMVKSNYIECNHGVNTSGVQAAMALSGNHEMMMSALSRAVDNGRLRYSECVKITELLERVIRGPFPPSDQEIYARAAKYAEQNDSAALKRAVELFENISDYRDAAKRATAAGKKYETILQMEKEQAVLEMEASKKRNKKLVAILLPITAVLIVAAVLISNVVKKNQEETARLEAYNAAIVMVEAGEYDEAIAAFISLGEYQDSMQQLEIAKKAKEESEKAKQEAEIEKAKADAYAEAVFLFDQGKYAQACAAFEALGDYMDSADRLNESWYYQGLKLLEEGDHETAYTSLINAEDYKDAREMLSKFQPIVISEEYTYGDNQGYTTYYEYTADGKLAKEFAENNYTTEYMYGSEGVLIQTKRLNYLHLVNGNPVYYLTDFDKNGSPVRIEYFEDDVQKYIWDFTYEYAEDGSILSLTCTYKKQYCAPITEALDFTAYGEKFYADTSSTAGTLYLNAYQNDETYVRYVISVNDSKITIEESSFRQMDSNGNLLRSTQKNVLGVEYTYSYENTYDEQGNLIQVLQTSDKSDDIFTYDYIYGFVYCPDTE